MKKALYEGDATTLNVYVGEHRWWPARLGLLPEGLQQRP